MWGVLKREAQRESRGAAYANRWAAISVTRLVIEPRTVFTTKDEVDGGGRKDQHISQSPCESQ
jgi:hypothetical protein